MKKRNWFRVYFLNRYSDSSKYFCWVTSFSSLCGSFYLDLQIQICTCRSAANLLYIAFTARNPLHAAWPNQKKCQEIALHTQENLKQKPLKKKLTLCRQGSTNKKLLFANGAQEIKELVAVYAF